MTASLPSLDGSPSYAPGVPTDAERAARAAIDERARLRREARLAHTAVREAVRAWYVAILADGDKPSPAAMGRALGISEGTVRSYTTDLRPEDS